MPSRHTISALCLVLPGVALGPAGGGDDRGWPERYPTRARVLFEGKPPVGATVVLHPAEKIGDPSAVPSRGEVGEDGTVTFSTYTTGDGVPEGEYVVSVFWTDASGRASTNRLPAKYLDPQTSGFKVRIVKSENEIATINLTK